MEVADERPSGRRVTIVRVNLRFYLDPQTGEPHVYEHDVDEDEVREALRNAGEERPGRGSSRVRTLRIVYVPDPEPRSLFVITAYDLRGKPLAAYRRRQRRKRRR